MKANRFWAVFAIAWLLGVQGALAVTWTRVYGGTNDERGGWLTIKPGGVLYLQAFTRAGLTAPADTMIAKLTTNGVVSWARQIGGTGDDTLQVIPTADGGFFVGGPTTSYGPGNPDEANYNILYAKYSSTWSPVFRRAWGGTADETGVFTNTADGGYFFYGASSSFSPAPDTSDIVAFKIRADGYMTWKKAWSAGEIEATADWAQQFDGHVLSFFSDEDPVLIKVSAEDGSLKWKRKFHSDKGLAGANVIATKDGHLLAALTEGSNTEARIVLVKLSGSDGTVLWQKRYSHPIDGLSLNSLYEMPTGVVVLNAQTEGAADVDFVSRPVFIRLSAAGVVNIAKRMSVIGLPIGASLLPGGRLLEGQSFPGGEDADLIFARMTLTNFAPVWARQFGGDGYENGTVGAFGSQYLLAGETESLGGGTVTQANLFVSLTSTNGTGLGIKTLNLTDTLVTINSTTAILTSTTFFTLTSRTTPVSASITIGVKTVTLPARSP